jgi:hypothetical protein
MFKSVHIIQGVRYINRGLLDVPNTLDSVNGLGHLEIDVRLKYFFTD